MRLIILAVILPAILAASEEPAISELVEVEIMPVEGFTVIGMDYTGSDHLEVIALWEEFVHRIDEIPRYSFKDDAYGVLLGYDETTGEFSYLACVQFDMTGPLPDGMMELSIPDGEYAVFTFPFDKLDMIYDYIYGEWLPLSDYTHGNGYDFEFYPEDFIPSEEGVLMQLYVSVE
ncbi:MAG: GyrI-like domain-containing protein [Candidatus Aegiribacteria sp.]|nr:GyrI-like domain-containing protein [Candidatus Aegiribacteria sp.]